MEWESLGRAIVAAAPVVTVLLGLLSRPERARSQMKLDAEVAKNLPEGSAAQRAVLRLIEVHAEALLKSRELKPDYASLGLALVGSFGLGFLALWLAGTGTWWGWLLAAPTAALWLVFFFGIFESAQRKDRVAEKAKREEKKAAKKAKTSALGSSEPSPK